MSDDKNYVRFYQMDEASQLMMVSNHGGCTEAVIGALNKMAEVRDIELSDDMTTDYVPPNDDTSAGEFRPHQVFKYRVLLQAGVSLPTLLGHLESTCAAAIDDQSLTCAIEIER